MKNTKLNYVNSIVYVLLTLGSLSLEAAIKHTPRDNRCTILPDCKLGKPCPMYAILGYRAPNGSCVKPGQACFENPLQGLPDEGQYVPQEDGTAVCAREGQQCSYPAVGPLLAEPIEGHYRKVNGNLTCVLD